MQRARSEMRDILSRPEFRSSRHGRVDLGAPEPPSWLSRKLEALGRALKRARDWLFRREVRAPVEGPRPSAGYLLGKYLFYVLLAVGAGLLIYLLAKLLLGKRAESRSQAVSVRPLTRTVEESALDHTSDEWQKRAMELVAGGDLRAAARALYLSLLVRLHRTRFIRYDRDKTNWEYVRGLAPASPLREPFASLTAFFDRSWYGQWPPDRAEFGRYSELVRNAAERIHERDTVG